MVNHSYLGLFNDLDQDIHADVDLDNIADKFLRGEFSEVKINQLVNSFTNLLLTKHVEAISKGETLTTTEINNLLVSHITDIYSASYKLLNNVITNLNKLGISNEDKRLVVVANSLDQLNKLFTTEEGRQIYLTEYLKG